MAVVMCGLVGTSFASGKAGYAPQPSAVFDQSSTSGIFGPLRAGGHALVAPGR